MSRKKKSKQPKLNQELKSAVEAAYKLGRMDGEALAYRQISEGSCN